VGLLVAVLHCRLHNDFTAGNRCFDLFMAAGHRCRYRQNRPKSIPWGKFSLPQSSMCLMVISSYFVYPHYIIHWTNRLSCKHVLMFLPRVICRASTLSWTSRNGPPCLFLTDSWKLSPCVASSQTRWLITQAIVQHPGWPAVKTFVAFSVLPVMKWWARVLRCCVPYSSAQLLLTNCF